MAKRAVDLVPRELLVDVDTDWYPTAEMRGIPQFRIAQSDAEEAFQAKVKDYFRGKFAPAVESVTETAETAAEAESEPKRFPRARRGHSEVVHGPRESFDTFIRRKYEEGNKKTPFYNAHILCPADSYPFLDALNEYALMNGLGPNIEARKAHKKKFELFDADWQISSTGKTFKTMEENIRTYLPPLEQALSLFRVYTYGFERDPVPGHYFKFDRLMSSALSYHYTVSFGKYKNSSKSQVHTRIDVLPGTTVYYLPNYNQNDIQTETEVVLLPNQRVHVYDATLCLEGRQSMRKPPVEMRCTEYHYDDKYPEWLPEVAYYFIISEPGRSYEYFPNHGGDSMFMGGSPALLITDKNQLGYGNAYEIMEKYVEKKESERWRHERERIRNEEERLRNEEERLRNEEERLRNEEERLGSKRAKRRKSLEAKRRKSVEAKRRRSNVLRSVFTKRPLSHKRTKKNKRRSSLLLQN
jgi:hypothetical protein